MIVWFAGAPGPKDRVHLWHKHFPKWPRLHSYWYMINNLFNQRWEFEMEKKRKGISLFVDSGAFTAHTKKVEINLKDYINFLKKNEKDIEIYANLDVIGDAEATLQNQKKMERAGLNPLPCFHKGEDFKYLDYYIKHCDYIALGGVAQSRNRRELTDWLNLCFDRICNDEGIPRVKTHGFAVTSVRLMHRYPWYSVDSKSWIFTGRHGGIYLPRPDGNKWRYDRNPMIVMISGKSPTQRKTKGRHFDTFTPAFQKRIDEYIRERGFTPEQCREEYRIRDILNVIYFLDLEKSFPPYPWPLWKVRTGGFGLI